MGTTLDSRVSSWPCAARWLSICRRYDRILVCHFFSMPLFKSFFRKLPLYGGLSVCCANIHSRQGFCLSCLPAFRSLHFFISFLDSFCAYLSIELYLSLIYLISLRIMSLSLSFSLFVSILFSL